MADYSRLFQYQYQACLYLSECIFHCGFKYGHKIPQILLNFWCRLHSPAAWKAFIFVFFLGKEIGQGEFGSVLEGTWKDNKTHGKHKVALKTLHADQLQTGKKEFLREAKVMCGLDHPCIVKLLGVCMGPPLMLVGWIYGVDFKRRFRTTISSYVLTCNSCHFVFPPWGHFWGMNQKFSWPVRKRMNSSPFVTVHVEPSVKSHIANSCYRSKSNNNPIHTSNNSKVQRIIYNSASGYRMKLN